MPRISPSELTISVTTRPQPPCRLTRRRNAVSVMPAMGATAYGDSSATLPMRTLSSPQNRSEDTADDAAFDGLRRGARHVFLERVGELRDGQGLQPDSSRAGEGREKDPVAAEDHVLDAGHRRDLKGHAGLKRPDVTGMDAKGFSRLKVFDHELTGQFQPRGSLSAQVLQQEAGAAKDAGAQRLLKADTELDLRSAAQEPVPMNHELVARADLDRHDVAGEFRGERQFS